jgi:hypothetical protein
LDKFRASQKKPGKSKLLRKQRNCPIPLIWWISECNSRLTVHTS